MNGPPGPVKLKPPLLLRVSEVSVSVMLTFPPAMSLSVPPRPFSVPAPVQLVTSNVLSEGPPVSVAFSIPARRIWPSDGRVSIAAESV